MVDVYPRPLAGTCYSPPTTCVSRDLEVAIQPFPPQKKHSLARWEHRHPLARRLTDIYSLLKYLVHEVVNKLCFSLCEQQTNGSTRPLFRSAYDGRRTVYARVLCLPLFWHATSAHFVIPNTLTILVVASRSASTRHLLAGRLSLRLHVRRARRSPLFILSIGLYD